MSDIGGSLSTVFTDGPGTASDEECGMNVCATAAERLTAAVLDWGLLLFTIGGTFANKPSTSIISLSSCVACRLNGMKNAVKYKKKRLNL
jgi:hypothetical protein